MRTPVGLGDGHPGGDEPPLTRFEHHILTGPQVGARITRVGVRRRFQAVVEHFQLHLHCWCAELRPGQLRRGIRGSLLDGSLLSKGCHGR